MRVMRCEYRYLAICNSKNISSELEIREGKIRFVEIRSYRDDKLAGTVSRKMNENAARACRRIPHR